MFQSIKHFSTGFLAAQYNSEPVTSRNAAAGLRYVSVKELGPRWDEMNQQHPWVTRLNDPSIGAVIEARWSGENVGTGNDNNGDADDPSGGGGGGGGVIVFLLVGRGQIIVGGGTSKHTFKGPDMRIGPAVPTNEWSSTKKKLPRSRNIYYCYCISANGYHH